MKRPILFSLLILIVISFVFVLGCSKTNTAIITITLPALTTDSLTNITATSAESGGYISSDGNSSITAQGVCWSTSHHPTITNNKTTDSSGAGGFISNLTGLTENTVYYIRAYATNSEGTAYGNEISFITKPTVATAPQLTTSDITGLTDTSAKSGGIIISDEGAAITAKGVCWDTTTNPTISNNFTSDGTGSGNFTSTIKGLIANTTYYVRAYATNSVGTGYGNIITFKTKNERDSTKVFAVSEATIITNKNMIATAADFSQPGTLEMDFSSNADSNIVITFNSKDTTPGISKKSNTDFVYSFSDVYKGTNLLVDADTAKYAGWTITGLSRKKYGFNRAKLIAVSNKTENPFILLRVTDLNAGEDSLITNQFYQDAITKNPFGVVKLQF